MKALVDWLIAWDIHAWMLLHVQWRCGLLDAMTPYLRNQFFWAPVYLFLLVFMPCNFGRRGLIWLAGFLLCFAIGDFLSGTVLKEYFQRTRPCNDEHLKQFVHLIVPRSSGYSFPSSHAANHFALGTFCAITFHHRLKWLWILPMSWALAVGYSQIYVGVHFPLDVIGGAVLGALVGTLVAAIFNRKWHLSDAYPFGRPKAAP